MTSTIAHEFKNTVVRQRPDDGYVDATAMCQANGKLFADYFRLETTQAFLDALSLTMGIPIVKKSKSTNLVLLEIKEGRYGGTWVHPKVAIHLGQWCSPEFAVFVSELVFDWMTGKAQSQLPQNPFLDAGVQQLCQTLMHADLTRADMRLLLLLQQTQAEGTLDGLALEQIEAGLGMSRATIYRALGRLEELGLAMKKPPVTMYGLTR